MKTHFERNVPSRATDQVWMREFSYDKENRLTIGKWFEVDINDYTTEDGIRFQKKSA